MMLHCHGVCLLVVEWKEYLQVTLWFMLRLSEFFRILLHSAEGTIEFCDRKNCDVFGLCPHLSGE